MVVLPFCCSQSWYFSRGKLRNWRWKLEFPSYSELLPSFTEDETRLGSTESISMERLQCSFWWQVWKEYMVGLWYSFQLLFDCVVCVCVYVFCHFFELWICNVYIDTYIYVIVVFFILHIYICWVSIIQYIDIIDGFNWSLYPLQTKSIRHLLDVENVSPVYYLGGSWGTSLEFQSTLP